ncbi:MAG TPA: dihydrofolate reductase family protein [Saprospiraceae bacterium]|nr:dihydrofolate reductase family protein [Saprospiraceae bacterium]HNT20973.1 dihydrofolate reductase family protein [Saprospiraceae bacterium]
MNEELSKVTIHLVSSLDGFIAKKDNSVSWFETTDYYEKGVTGEDEEEFLKTIGCYVIGAHTYEHTLEIGWPYGETPVTVVTHRNLRHNGKNIEFYSGSLEKLVNAHLKPKYRNIWIAGGAMLAEDIIRLNLADDLRLSILPVMLGDGKRFLDHIGREEALHLKDVTAYKSGMVELWYEIR